LRSYGGLSRKTLKKNPIFFAFFGENDHFWKNSVLKHSSPNRSTCYFQISWNLADRKSVKLCIAYLTKKTKFHLALQLLLLHGLLPKPARANRRQLTQECSRFHPNRFTFSRVIPECVNTIKTGRKVFPIFGWSLALSQIKMNTPYCNQ